MAGRIIHCKVTDEYILGDGVIVGAAGSHKDVTIRLEFGEMWHGTTKTVVWVNAYGENPTFTLLTTNLLEPGETEIYLVPIPAEAKEFPGTILMTIKGVTVEGQLQKSATLNAVAKFTVLDSRWGEEPEDINATLSEQLQAEVDDIKGKITILGDQIDQTKEYAKKAVSSAAQASVSEENAATSAQNAKESAQSASQSQTIAQEAKESALASKESAQTASMQAQEAVNTIFFGKNPEENSLRVLTRYTGTVTSLLDLPPWSFITDSGANLQPVLQDFTDILSPEFTYSLIKKSVLNWEGPAMVFELIRMNGLEHWVGYVTSQTSQVHWENVSYETVKNLYAGRDQKQNNPRLLTNYSGEIQSIQELPPWSLIAKLGADIQPLLTDFSWELNSKNTYILTKKTVGDFYSQSIVYDLTRMNGLEHWVGYITSQISHVIWADVSFEKINFLENDLYSNRNTNENNARLLTNYSGSLKSIDDMPPWSFIAKVGSVIQPLLNDFSATLEPNNTYILTKKTIGDFHSQSIVYDLTRMNGLEHWVGYITSQISHVVWTDISFEKVNLLDQKLSKFQNGMGNRQEPDVPELFVYTEFFQSPGFWNETGALGSTFTHTNLFKIIPGGPCYLVNTANQEVQGAFFDQFGQWISPILLSEITDYSYKSPDGNGAASPYVILKKFDAPENAYFASLNVPTTNQYRLFIASKPVFPYQNTGNILVLKNNNYQRTKNEKLCVIGPSTVMIDRLYRSAISQYLCGWQEYVYPWFDSFDSYGFSGGSMGSGYTEYTSIYDGIVSKSVDLSKYDTFIIFGSKNGLTTTGVGSWGEIENLPEEHDSYMGGLRHICEYIYTQNKMAKIYLCTMPYSGSYYTNPQSYRPLIDNANELTREMANVLGMNVIDLAFESGFNQKNYYNDQDPTAGYTYDGTHFNQLGSYVIGKCIRKNIIGF